MHSCCLGSGHETGAAPSSLSVCLSMSLSMSDEAGGKERARQRERETEREEERGRKREREGCAGGKSCSEVRRSDSFRAGVSLSKLM